MERVNRELQFSQEERDERQRRRVARARRRRQRRQVQSDLVNQREPVSVPDSSWENDPVAIQQRRRIVAENRRVQQMRRQRLLRELRQAQGLDSDSDDEEDSDGPWSNQESEPEIQIPLIPNQNDNNVRMKRVKRRRTIPNPNPKRSSHILGVELERIARNLPGEGRKVNRIDVLEPNPEPKDDRRGEFSNYVMDYRELLPNSANLQFPTNFRLLVNNVSDILHRDLHVPYNVNEPLAEAVSVIYYRELCSVSESEFYLEFFTNYPTVSMIKWIYTDLMNNDMLRSTVYNTFKFNL